MQLINKGGFRERANRSRKYQNSENKTATLQPTRYCKNEQSTQNNVQVDTKQPK